MTPTLAILRMAEALEPDTGGTEVSVGRVYVVTGRAVRTDAAESGVVWRARAFVGGSRRHEADGDTDVAAMDALITVLAAKIRDEAQRVTAGAQEDVARIERARDLRLDVLARALTGDAARGGSREGGERENQNDEGGNAHGG